MQFLASADFLESAMPLPAESLTYNTELGGYQVAITNDQLTNARRYSSSDTWDWEDRSRTRAINDYYGVPFGAYGSDADQTG
jgi:hypothetical protein